MNETVLVDYIRDANGHVEAALATDASGKFGISVRNPKDLASKPQARKTAVGRLKSNKNYVYAYMSNGVDRYITPQKFTKPSNLNGLENVEVPLKALIIEAVYNLNDRANRYFKNGNNFTTA